MLVHNDCLPSLDTTGKVHGALPQVKDLSKYTRDQLLQFRNDLKASVKKRIETTVKHGRDRPHGQRQGQEQEQEQEQEQDLIKSIDKRLGL